MDSTEVPVYQEQSAYNGHFESACYHPLLLFNGEGDCLAGKLRPGNVHSAEDWEEVFLPEIGRQQEQLGDTEPGGGALLQQAGDSGAVDQGRQAGGEDDEALLPSVPPEPSAAGTEPSGLQPVEFVAATGVAPTDRELVAGESAATASEDRGTAGATCTLLLAIVGGRTSQPAAVRGDAGPDRAATATDGIESWWPRQQRNLSTAGLG